MKPTSWFRRSKDRNCSVSRASERRASPLNQSSFDAAHSCHISPGQKPPVHQLSPSKGEASQRSPPR